MPPHVKLNEKNIILLRITLREGEDEGDNFNFLHAVHSDDDGEISDFQLNNSMENRPRVVVSIYNTVECRYSELHRTGRRGLL